MLLRQRLLLSCLCAMALAGCRAQGAPDTPQINRRIEVQVRQQLGVPPDWNVAIGPHQKSDFPGYDQVPVTFSPATAPSKKQTLDFLLSKDGNTLARLSKWDISKDPSDVASTAGRPVRGDASAKVTVINFDDLACPYCAKMHATLFPETLDHYKGLVKFVYKDYPLVEIHPWAMRAAIDANCLAEQSGPAYWSYVDYLHTHGEDISGPTRDVAKSNAALDKQAHAEGVTAKLDLPKLDACVAKQDPSAVNASLKEGEALGVDGTPTMFINGERLSGALPAARVWAAIDRALRAEGITPPPNEVPAAPAGR